MDIQITIELFVLVISAIGLGIYIERKKIAAHCPDAAAILLKLGTVYRWHLFLFTVYHSRAAATSAKREIY